MTVLAEPALPSTLVIDNRFTRELPGDPQTVNQRRQVAGACFSRVSPTAVSAPYLIVYAREVAELIGLAPDAFERQAPGQTGPGQTGPGQTGPGQTGPQQTGPGQTGPQQTDLEQTGPGQGALEQRAANRGGLEQETSGRRPLDQSALGTGLADGLTPEDLVQVFAGNRLLEGMDPYACCYGGHQFGNWAGQLGDGRAINLGEAVNANGERYTLQLKGAGPTPYSRTADGLAVLRSSVREFLCSEAMFHLGVPTTRALCLVGTGEQVLRDMFYDGNARHEPGAVVCRVARSFTRFGSFEIHAARGDVDVLRTLADFTIRHDFAHLLPGDGAPTRDTYLRWFDEVCRSTATLMAHWMRVGFVHGVMNTDNMSVLGLTIDYGPYGWLEDFDPDWTPNTTDAGGRRYRYGHQPQVALWNLVQLANAIYPLVEDADPLRASLESYSVAYLAEHHAMMAAKLGLDGDGSGDAELFNELHQVLQLAETDMTLFYRLLPDVDLANAETLSDEELLAPLADAYYDRSALSADGVSGTAAWLRRYAARAAEDGLDAAARCERMHAVNPRYVLRNYLAQLAIDDAEQGDFALVNELLDVLRRPYDEQPDKARFAEKRPDWARHRAGCSMLSCSS